jgi:hypothetical protein
VTLVSAFHRFLKMKNRHLRVFADESAALVDRRYVGRAARPLREAFAAEKALHPHPVPDGDFLPVDPLEIVKAALAEERLETG